MKYDVFIYHKESRVIDAVIGENMERWDGRGHPLNTVELREQSGRERVNDSYGVTSRPAGKFKKGDKLP
jgi:hypothetical protein